MDNNRNKNSSHNDNKQQQGKNVFCFTKKNLKEKQK